METSMTAIIVIAQGHDIAGRRKTCTRASTASKGAPLETTAHEFASRRAIRARSTKDPSVSFAIPTSGMIDPPGPSYGALVKGEDVEWWVPRSRSRQGMIRGDVLPLGAELPAPATTRPSPPAFSARCLAF
jgi:hypothetical protein